MSGFQLDLLATTSREASILNLTSFSSWCNLSSVFSKSFLTRAIVLVQQIINRFNRFTVLCSLVVTFKGRPESLNRYRFGVQNSQDSRQEVKLKVIYIIVKDRISFLNSSYLASQYLPSLLSNLCSSVTNTPKPVYLVSCCTIQQASFMIASDRNNQCLMVPASMVQSYCLNSSGHFQAVRNLPAWRWRDLGLGALGLIVS